MRRYLYDNYGEKKLYEGGLSVRTTLDPKLQMLARKTMINGLVNFDESQGYRGPVTTIDVGGDWGIKLADVKSLDDITPWRMAVVLQVDDQSARIGLAAAARSRRRRGQGPRDRHRAARRREMGKGRRPGRRSRSRKSARCSTPAT